MCSPSEVLMNHTVRQSPSPDGNDEGDVFSGAQQPLDPELFYPLFYPVQQKVLTGGALIPPPKDPSMPDG